MAKPSLSTSRGLIDARALFARCAPRFEAALGVFVKTTRIEATADSKITAAAVDSDRLVLGADFFEADERAKLDILAHEAVHLAQKWRGESGARSARRSCEMTAALESQAHRLGAAALAGRRVETPLADPSPAPSFWGPAGHYYASLFVMLAAGIEEAAAYQRAFFCQMPDQVFEFDAVSAAIDYRQTGTDGPGSVWVPWVGTFRPATPPEMIEYQKVRRLHFDGMAKYWDEEFVETAASRQRRRRIDWEISTGLHCLTGRKGADEIKYRESLLFQNKDDNLKFGLALHSFGDAFAHQDKQGHMYKPITGHAFDGHTPDNCKEHAVNFIQYVGRLWIIARQVAQRRECVEFSPMLDSLQPLWTMKADGDDDSIQSHHCGMIIQAAARCGLGNIGRFYRPQDKAEVYWKNFWPQNTRVIASKAEADRIYRVTRECGAAWAL